MQTRAIFGWEIPYGPLRFFASWLGVYPSFHEEAYYLDYVQRGLIFWFLRVIAAAVLMFGDPRCHDAVGRYGT